MRADPPPIDPAILEQAAQWFALLRSESATKADRRRWQAWLSACPAHRTAWARVEAFTRRLEGLPAHAVSAALGTADRGRRRALKTLAFLCTAGVAGWGAWRGTPWREWMADHRTGVGGTRSVILADGTRLWLNTASALDVEFTSPLRRLLLQAGEVLIETASDPRVPSRPFVVDCADGRVRALGTRFSLHQQDDHSRAAVFEGAIEIQPAAPAAARRTLNAGQETRFTRQSIDAPQPANQDRTAWTRGMLLADDLPLGEFVAELARYRHGYLGCAPEVEDLRLVGAFPLGDTDRVLAALERTLPVRVRALTPWWVSIEPR
ncbi:MAG: FecR domain-containing protein [Gammaproteobacteria bacterium]